MSDGQFKPLMEVFGFTSEWRQLGIVTETLLEELSERFRTSGDLNTEHYRWSAFKEYLARNNRLEQATFEQLVNLAINDEDKSLGISMLHEIIDRTDCSESIVRLIGTLGDKSLQKKVKLRLNTSS